MVDRYQKLYGIGPGRSGTEKGFKDEAEDLIWKAPGLQGVSGAVHGGKRAAGLIQPHWMSSDYARLLKEHGEGHIHHISILTDRQAFHLETMAE